MKIFHRLLNKDILWHRHIIAVSLTTHTYSSFTCFKLILLELFIRGTIGTYYNQVIVIVVIVTKIFFIISKVKLI